MSTQVAYGELVHAGNFAQRTLATEARWGAPPGLPPAGPTEDDEAFRAEAALGWARVEEEFRNVDLRAAYDAFLSFLQKIKIWKILVKLWRARSRLYQNEILQGNN